ncbi:TOMM precursor leader peptide-binding protein [Actinoallomurus purpureus]|uniref:TOMM precursor leader peptide-binding protein n=1 Tax=Actinoallomurus purpureus TaxID=478114 RepID=UPI002092B154|nr:TOMM precursor leader peptide-binding protein [Actinoallomurus purpureus]MCO6006961.1 TOMM precursor leader peptide-binding protein [Actinoallomurus purpureus]
MSEVLATRPAPTPPVCGSGGLRAALEGVPVPDGVFVVATDTEDAETYAMARAYAREHGFAWLPVRADTGWVLIGPAVRPGVPGCPTCLWRRRDANRPDAAARRVLAERYGSGLGGGPLMPVLCEVVAALVRDEVTEGFRRTDGGLLRVSARTAAVTSHRLMADPLCPDCGNRPQDRPARLRLGSVPKPDPAVFRSGPLPVELERHFVDAEVGLIGSMGMERQGDLPTVVARLAPGRKGDTARHGYGRGFDVGSARRTAIAEALERYASARPRGRRPVVRAPYADIADRALDPRTLGLYPDAWYEEPGFDYVRFDPDRDARWVWGYSFGTDRAILVPLTVAYHNAATRAEPGPTSETSNGAALGGCLAEAIFYGLLEVAERDAFLMTWYARLPVPKIDLDTAADRRIRVLAAKARYDAGYELMAFAMPMEQRVPAIWAMALDRTGHPGRPHALCAAGAHPDPEQALRTALFELLPSVTGLGDRYDEQDSAAMLADSDQVRELEDHRQLYCHPGAGHRLAFLPAQTPGRPLGELLEGWPQHDDLTDDLAELVGRYLTAGLDVIAIETTCPELRAGGFAAAKVLVPGTLPMTFGHRYRRTHGLSRLLTVPRLLGHHDRDLRPDQLNPFPHPFP